jgi:hypothetical protein
VSKREAGKRNRCEERAATEQVRAKVKQRYKRMTDFGTGEIRGGARGAGRCRQKHGDERARERKRRDVGERERERQYREMRNATDT